jgi:DNA-binding MarR family transcriptional regulator
MTRDSAGVGTTSDDLPASDNSKAQDFDMGILPSLVGFNLRRAQVAVFQDFAISLQSYRITPGQFGVLTIIQCNPGLNQTRLGEAMGVDRSTVVAVIDRLQSRGLVCRAPSEIDRRSYALHLSDEGARLMTELNPIVRAHDRRMASRLSPEEVVVLNRLLSRLATG